MNKDFDKLANEFQKGNIKAGEEIFDHFFPVIFRFFMVRILNRQISEDLTQEVFLRVVGKIDSFNLERGRFGGWIWQIARNILIDHFRGKKDIISSDAAEFYENFKDETDIERDIARRMEVDNIFKVVNSLSEGERDIFSMHYLSDVSYEEISRITCKSEGAIRVVVHRINKKIKDMINNNAV